MPIGTSDYQRRGPGSRWAGLLGFVFFIAHTSVCLGDLCVACQKEIRGTIYIGDDAVARTKFTVCGECMKTADRCHLCGRPVGKELTRLPDGRTICQRDTGAVVLDDREAVRICEQVKKDLDRQFSRFLTIPEDNVTIQLMDRVRLQEIYLVIGNDFACPDTRGCTETKTNDGRRVFEISILSGHPREELMTTCVHEYAHTWVIENVPRARLSRIGKDAVEGFCELLAFLFAEAQGLEAAKAEILANHYTRGQIHLFIAAHRQYGFQDIVDWMKFGDDPLLLREDLSRVRRLEDRPKSKITAAEPASASRTAVTARPPPTLPEKLVLQGIIWSKTRPMATINGRNFDPKQESVIQLREGTITVRCLEIRPTSVLLQTNNSSENLVLEMK